MKQRTLAVSVLAAVVVLLVLPAAPPALQAQGGSIGLGIALGAAFPARSTPGIPSTDGRASFNWGFYVNIPPDLPAVLTMGGTPAAG